MLKGRFQSLKELCFWISLKKMHQFVILWITCCLILYNLVICIEEEAGTLDLYEWYQPVGDEEEDEEDEEGGGIMESVSTGQLFHDKMMVDLLNSIH